MKGSVDYIQLVSSGGGEGGQGRVGEWGMAKRVDRGRSRCLRYVCGVGSSQAQVRCRCR